MATLRCNPQYVVYDLRETRDFKQISISGYKKLDVSRAFQAALINSKLEDALRWCVELHCTGMNAKIWETLYVVYLQYIHVNNPHLYRYFIRRRKDYFRLISPYPSGHEAFTRNDQTIRNLYAEMVAIVSLSKKTPLFNNKSIPNLSPKLLYDKMELKKRMLGHPVTQIAAYYDPSDPGEIKLGLNEIYSNIYDDRGNFPIFAFWIMWLEKIGAFKKKQQSNLEISLFDMQEEFKCCPTVIEGVKEEYQTHWVWKVWKFILDYKRRRSLSKEAEAFIERAFEDFVDEFKPAQYNRKKYLIYLSFYAIKNMIHWDLVLYPRIHLMYQAIGNINMMYGYINQELTKNLPDAELCRLEKMYIKLYQEVCLPEKKMLAATFVPEVVGDTHLRAGEIMGGVVGTGMKVKSREEVLKEKRLKSFMKNDAAVPDDVYNKIDFSVGPDPTVETVFKKISTVGGRKDPPTYDRRIERRSRGRGGEDGDADGDNGLVSKLIRQEELERLREEKKNYKMQAFKTIIPTKTAGGPEGDAGAAAASPQTHSPSPPQSSTGFDPSMFQSIAHQKPDPEVRSISFTKRYKHSYTEDDDE